MTTWRKGLRWDKKKKGWINVKTSRKLSQDALKRRKAKPSYKRKTKQPGWRKGLRWDKREKKWREIATKRLLTDRAVRFRTGYLSSKKELYEAEDERETAFRLIKQVLKEAVEGLESEGFASDMGRPHKNKDGSIDAVLRVKPKKGQTVNEVYLAMEEYLSPIPGMFVSTAVRYHPRKGEEFYTKFRGMSQAQAYYQDMSPEKLHFNFMSGKEINKNMIARGRLKAEQVVVLINWNPEHERPQTPWQREVQRARKKRQ